MTASSFCSSRVDPYYRTLAAARPETQRAIDALIASLEDHPRALVHADFSPKNMLLFDAGTSEGLMLVDFETGHYGDPAFDLGFFLSHLVLKACYHLPDHGAVLGADSRVSTGVRRANAARHRRRGVGFAVARGIQNFAGCAWARLDGKSPVEYLHDASRRELIRALCREILANRRATWQHIVELANDQFARAVRSGSFAIGKERAP